MVTQPTARVKIKAVSARSKLKVDVNPNMGSKYWTFQVQRKNLDGSWKALKTYRTWGSTEKRTLNLRKGTYRVWVNPKFGHQGCSRPTRSRSSGRSGLLSRSAQTGQPLHACGQIWPNRAKDHGAGRYCPL